MPFSFASLSFWELLLWCAVLAITFGAGILIVSTLYPYHWINLTCLSLLGNTPLPNDLPEYHSP